MLMKMVNTLIRGQGRRQQSDPDVKDWAKCGFLSATLLHVEADAPSGSIRQEQLMIHRRNKKLVLLLLLFGPYYKQRPPCRSVSALHIV